MYVLALNDGAQWKGEWGKPEQGVNPGILEDRRFVDYL